MEKGRRAGRKNAGGQEKRGGSVMSQIRGIDIGGTTVKLGMFEAGRTLLEKWEIPTRRKKNGGARISWRILRQP